MSEYVRGGTGSRPCMDCGADAKNSGMHVDDVILGYICDACLNTRPERYRCVEVLWCYRDRTGACNE